jgi:hypothetical protein
MQKIVAGFVALLLFLLAVETVQVVSASISGSWTIKYFTVSGNSCTNIPYTPTAKDGGGFGNPSGIDPIVTAGQSICVNIVALGATPNTVVYWKLDSIINPMQVGTTDGSGNLNVQFVVTVPQSVSGSTCFTSPELIALGSNSPQAFNGNIIDHFWVGSANCTIPPFPPIPEFPLGVFVVLIPSVALLILLRRTLGKIKLSTR